MTDRELLEQIAKRQEALISTISTLTDVLVDVRDNQRELLEWAQEPPSSDMGEILTSLTASVDGLREVVVAQGEEMPGRVAEELRQEA